MNSWHAAASAVLAFTTATAASAAEPRWHEVKEFTGSGTKNTEDFEIPDREWRISWESTGRGLFHITVMNDKDEPVDVASSEGPGKDSTIIRGSGKYYLNVLTTHKWKLKIETKH